MENVSDTIGIPRNIGLLADAAREVRLGRFDEAIAHLKRLLDTEPRNEIALGMLAGIYAQIGLHDRAIEQYRRVLVVNPGNPLARFQLGLSQLQSGRPADALETWHATQVEESDYLVHHFSGIALLDLGRNDEARAILDQAQRHMPANHTLYPQLVALRARAATP
jgi:Flp pilus assembly protein TadD